MQLGQKVWGQCWALTRHAPIPLTRQVLLLCLRVQIQDSFTLEPTSVNDGGVRDRRLDPPYVCLKVALERKVDRKPQDAGHSKAICYQKWPMIKTPNSMFRHGPRYYRHAFGSQHRVSGARHRHNVPTTVRLDDGTHVETSTERDRHRGCEERGSLPVAVNVEGELLALRFDFHPVVGTRRYDRQFLPNRNRKAN